MLDDGAVDRGHELEDGVHLNDLGGYWMHRVKYSYRLSNLTTSFVMSEDDCSQRTQSHCISALFMMKHKGTSITFLH